VIAVGCRIVFLPVSVTNQITQLMQRFDHPTVAVDFFMIQITTSLYVGSFAKKTATSAIEYPRQVSD
jgi:hypothetical protein